MWFQYTLIKIGKLIAYMDNHRQTHYWSIQRPSDIPLAYQEIHLLKTYPTYVNQISLTSVKFTTYSNKTFYARPPYQQSIKAHGPLFWQRLICYLFGWNSGPNIEFLPLWAMLWSWPLTYDQWWACYSRLRCIQNKKVNNNIECKFWKIYIIFH